MADATDVRALLLKVDANIELLRSNMSAAERAVAEFHTKTLTHLSNVDKGFASFGKSITALEKPLEHLKAVGETAFAFLLGESLLLKGKEALEFAGNIEFLSQQIGVSTKFLQEFRYASSQSGASIEVSDTALRKFSRTVGEAANGNAGVVKLFDRLGVSVLDSGGKVRSVEAVYKDFSNAIQKIPDPAQRTADVLRVMGRDAGALIPTVAAGASGFSDLAAAANQLGVVLSPELIEHAEGVNHKLAALKLIVDAQMASAVGQNAAAIESLASSLVTVAGAITRFLATNPERALGILGGLAGLKLGGIPGALAGAAIGSISGYSIKATAEHDSNDLLFRRQRFEAARQNYRESLNQSAAVILNAQESGVPLPDRTVARQNFLNEGELFKRALAARFNRPAVANLGSTDAGDHNPDISRPKKPKKPKVDHTAEREANADRAFQAELERAQSAYAKAELALSDTAEGRLKVAIDDLQFAKQQRDLEIDDQVKAHKISAAQGAKLKALNDSTELDQEALERRKELERALTAQVDRLDHESELQVELLNVDSQLAGTRKERLAIERRILALDQAREKRDLELKLQTAHDSTDKANIQADINNLPTKYAARDKALANSNQSPIEAYRKQIRDASSDMNDALQGVVVNGLQNLESGLLGVINGTKSVGSAFKDLAASIIADLARIAIEKEIIGPLTSLLGFKDGGEIPKFADGGEIEGAGGPRSDSIIARVSRGEFIINAEATQRNLALLHAINDNRLPRFADGGQAGLRSPRLSLVGSGRDRGSNIVVHVEASPYFDAKVVSIAAPLATAGALGGADLASERAARTARYRLA